MDNFEKRMYQLERNGYFNVVGLKRKFAIEVDDYDEKEFFQTFGLFFCAVFLNSAFYIFSLSLLYRRWFWSCLARRTF